jgi:hypothetical protein
MSDSATQRLQHLCEEHQVDRFSPDEMVSLLEDGEEVGWIVDQVAAGKEEGVTGALTSLLEEIAAQVAPEPVDEPEEEPQPTAVSTAEEVPPPSAPAAPPQLDLEALQGMELPPGLDASQLEQMLSSPRGALLADFGVFCQERGLAEGEPAGPEAEEALRQLHEEWLQTPRETLDGKRPADLLEGGGLFPEKVETFRREAPKVGRNDPCPCGSGRKYKKCCGRAA